MRHYKVIEDGYISAIGIGPGNVEISSDEFNQISTLVSNSPVTDKGYDYRLKEDLTWELVEVPIIDPADEEVSGNELLGMIQEVL